MKNEEKTTIRNRICDLISNRAKSINWITAALVLIAALILGVHLNETREVDYEICGEVDTSIYDEAKKDDGTYRMFSGVVKRGDARYGVKGKYAVVIEGWPNENGECIIRSRVRGKRVAGISKWTFAEGKYNMGCYYLTDVTIPDSVIYIDEGTFHHAVALEKITVDKGNKHYYDIDGILFSTNNQIIAYPMKKAGNEYHIPENITHIAGFAFAGCDNLSGITVPVSVTGIGDYAFWRCYDLTSITIPESVTSIGYGAFSTYNPITIKAPHAPSYYGYTPTENETWVIE